MHRAVDTLGNKVRAAVAQHPVDGHFGVTLQIGLQRSDHLVLTKSVRSQHAQHALRLLGDAAQIVLDPLPALQQRFRMRIAAFAVLGQLHDVRGALHQLQAEQLFQRLQAAADGRLAGFQTCGRRRQAACFNDAHEGLHQFYTVCASKRRFVHTLIV